MSNCKFLMTLVCLLIARVMGEVYIPVNSIVQYGLTLKNSLSTRSVAINEVERKERLGVLLLNLGGPETLKDVEGFLYNLFSDPDIIRLPSGLSLLQKPLAYAVARSRSKKSSEAYASIGGGSPIVRYTTAQAELIQSELHKRGHENAKCYFAMRYWHPFTEETLARIEADGITKLVIVPLYPHYSISTSGSSFKVLDEIFRKPTSRWLKKVSHTVVPSWYNRPGYIRTMVKLLLSEIKSFTFSDMKEGIHVLFSAHGVPVSYIEAGDPYKAQIEECVRLIVKEASRMLTFSDSKKLFGRPTYLPEDGQTCTALAGDVATNMQKLRKICSETGSCIIEPTIVDGSVKEIAYHLSFQSRVGPVQWLQPYTDTTIEALGKHGVKNLVVVPISFVSEHIETLEEIDMEYKELAHHSGIVNWRRTPALNTDGDFINELTDIVEEALVDPVISVSEVSSTNLDFLYQQGLCLPGKHRPSLGLRPKITIKDTQAKRWALIGAVTGVCTLLLTMFNLLLPC